MIHDMLNELVGSSRNEKVDRLMTFQHCRYHRGFPPASDIPPVVRGKSGSVNDVEKFPVRPLRLTSAFQHGAVSALDAQRSHLNHSVRTRFKITPMTPMAQV